MKSKLLIIFSICISILYAEENTYIKQQVAYKDQGASGKELTWNFGMLSPINEEYTVAYSIPERERVLPIRLMYMVINM